MWNGPDLEMERGRVAWWLFVLGLGTVFAYVAFSFLNVLVVGVFAYYVARPLRDRLDDHLSDETAAGVAILLVVLPVLALVVYAGIEIVQAIRPIFAPGQAGYWQPLTRVLGLESLSKDKVSTLSSLVNNPISVIRGNQQTIRQLLSTAAGLIGTIALILLKLALALTLAFYLLRSDDWLSGWFRDDIAGRDSAAYSYTVAVDRDFHFLFVGNVLFIVVMAVIATVVYMGTNFLAPNSLRIPFPILLGALTGVASIIPIVVGKVVYVPVVAYLAVQAVRSNAPLWIPAALLAVSFLLLDILPQTFLQPYITGRRIDFGLLLFGYLLGPILFGPIGFLLLPMLIILGIEVVRFVVVELVHGEDLDPWVESAPSMGAWRPDRREEDASSSDADETA